MCHHSPPPPSVATPPEVSDAAATTRLRPHVTSFVARHAPPVGHGFEPGPRPSGVQSEAVSQRLTPRRVFNLTKLSARSLPSALVDIYVTCAVRTSLQNGGEV